MRVIVASQSFDLDKFSIQSGDLLVLRSLAFGSEESAERIAKELSRHTEEHGIEGCTLLVLPPGMDLRRLSDNDLGLAGLKRI